MKSVASTVLLTCAIALATPGSINARDADPAQFARLSYLSDADLLSEESSAQFQAARRFVRASQCAAHAPNPLIHIAPPLGPGVRGAAPGTLRVSTVSNFPNEYLKDITALAETPGVPPEVAGRMRREMQPNYEKLTQRVRLLIAEYDPRGCARQTATRSRWSEIIDQPINP